MKCTAKHVYESDTWHCPKCGSTNFFIDEPSEDADQDCGKLHSQDLCRCYDCGYETVGHVASRYFKKLDSMTECPCCKGTGFVKEGFER